ncbi:MAG TPA: UvrD-helicase domain-containing protein [Gammaproteobacteria bacterium]|jgi:ATP-dependent exoDNAse (exonuclease V) beta subunit
MNEAALAADSAARAQALDVEVSCIVRAPAGSGKTELLTQRYLALLATVEEPEEIIAVTFTRKAAGEMRSRIVAALESAAGPIPEQAHKRATWELAKRAQVRDQERAWQLTAHPARMRIQTIDSLNAELTRQMPLLSGFGAQPRVNERPLELHEEAARRSLRLLDEGEPEQAAAVRGLAQHLDNDLSRIHRLLARMLARRDQWLRHLGSDRAGLEEALAREVNGHLLQVSATLPRDCRQELVDLLGSAGQVLRGEGSESAIVACADLMTMPAADASGLRAWAGIAEFLLTAKGGWRARHDKRQGVLKDDAAMKARTADLLRRLEGHESCRALLALVPCLPEPRYSDEQWRVLEALLKLLPLGVAQLRLVFADRGEVDFAEISLSALQALGEPEAPTDLALALDYRIRHLLVDEFQDTSVNQFKLLEMFTAGWQLGDGRTLFLVGDPAQSIYRFREAEVGLFLRAWEHGLGQVSLEALQLHANFRSRPALVEWSNRSFARIFPTVADVASGAVPYVDAAARRETASGTAVQVHGFADAGDGTWRDAEAARVIDIIEAARGLKQSTAVLVRAKNHLAAVVRGLRRQGVHFRAVEVENLGGQPVVQDLLALTRALAHPADRTAWLAVLRAPWCALSLSELHSIAAGDLDAAIPACMLVADELAKSHPRFAHTRAVLLGALADRARGSLREQVEHTWIALGGPAALAGAEALADAQAYLELLEELDEGGALPSAANLERRLALLFARPDPEADDSLQLMTIHKAKGLEFDVVVLPGLAAATRGEDQDLLVWLERPRAEQEADILLAPLDAPGQDHKDPLYAWVRLLRKEQARLEKARLLYVAVTRARERLHLLGAVTAKEKDGQRELAEPKPGSLLALLWPTVKEEFEHSLDAASTPVAATQGREAPGFTRLRRTWVAPEPGAAVAWAGSTVLASEEVPEFEWVGETLRHVGTVVHRLLQRIAEDGVARWDMAQRKRAIPLVWQLLTQAGVAAAELDAASSDVMLALENTFEDERGRWLLQAHEHAHCEYALNTMREGRLVIGVIDRTFVDAEGIRWIIDYKTTRHSSSDVDAFLQEQRKRYAPQLERYAFLIRGMEARRVKVALYFPLQQRFLSWEPADAPEP